MTLNNLPKTKIVATLGPATDSVEKIGDLIEAGCSITRLNFSHGTHKYHKELFKKIRQASEEKGKFVGILQDLCGPKLRLGEIEGSAIQLNEGEDIFLTTKKIKGNQDKIPVQYPTITKDVEPGSRILLADGLIELLVVDKSEEEIECRVVAGGTVRSKQGINLPGVNISIPTITEKDVEDLKLGVELGVDFVALSFVRSAQDVEQLKSIIEDMGANIPVISKLERNEAVENLDSILEVSDGVMVARGDLGVELPPEDVPILQKKIIKRANEKMVPVITATQMLESMVNQARPTRAETSDVANAILDGTDAVMLSAETAVGKYACKAVEMMSRIALETETMKCFLNHHKPEEGVASTPGLATAKAVCGAAGEVQAKLITAFTQSGTTTRWISNQRPCNHIIGITPFEKVARKMSLFRGVTPLVIDFFENMDEAIPQMDKILLEKNLIQPGENIVVSFGYPLLDKGVTNSLYIHTVE